MKRIAMGVLTHKRPHVLHETLETFVKLNYGCLDQFYITVCVQGAEKETYKVIEKFRPYIDSTLTFLSNKGCGWGYVQLMRECLKFDTPYLLYLEDDFMTCEPLTNYLDFIYKFFKYFPEYGYIRLRSWRETKAIQFNKVFGKHFFIATNDPLDVPFDIYLYNKDASQTIFRQSVPFSFNPSLIRREVLKRMLPVGDEFKYNERVAAKRYNRLIKLETARLHANCFRHNVLSRRWEGWRL